MWRSLPGDWAGHEERLLRIIIKLFGEVWEIMSRPCRGCKSRCSFINTHSDIQLGFKLALNHFYLFLSCFFLCVHPQVVYWVSWALWSKILDSWTEGWVCLVCWQRKNTNDHQCLFRAKQWAVPSGDAERWCLDAGRDFSKNNVCETKQRSWRRICSSLFCFPWHCNDFIVIQKRLLKKTALARGPEQSQTN